MYRAIKVIVEHHTDGYIAYPLGLKSVVGQGDSYAQALQDVESAIRFHIESFGEDVLDPAGARSIHRGSRHPRLMTAFPSDAPLEQVL